MKRPATRTLAVLAFACAMAVPAASQTTFKDAKGASVTLKSAASRIVSLSPAITEILYASGAGKAVVGVTQFCNYPADALSKPKVAGFGSKSVNLEAIVALKPDVVLGELSSHRELADAFSAAGQVLVLLDLSDFGDVTDAMLFSGRLAGTDKAAAAAVAAFEARVLKVETTLRTANPAKPLVFWEVWDEPLMTAGPGTFVDILINEAGGRNAFSDVKEAWPMVSFEQIVARNPDVFMSPFTHGEKMTPENLGKRPGWAGLRAVRDRRIFLLSDDIVSRPGPRLADALELLAASLHPDLFPGGRSDVFRPRTALAGALFLVPLLVLACVSVGSVRVPLAGIADILAGGGDPTQRLILGIRLTRCLLALTVGAGLAVAGCAYQGMFGNPLADPYVIGSSSGAALGAVVSISMIGRAAGQAVLGVGSAAFLGSAAAVAASYSVSRSFRGSRTSTSLLLAGTAVGSLFSAVTTLILTLDDRQLHPAFFWILGGFTGSDSEDLLYAFPVIAAGAAALFLCSRALDVLSQGDEESLALGLKPGRARLLIGAIATFIVAEAVSVSGTIGFVGLVAPHIARRFSGPAHRFSMPLSALAGGVLLLLSDTVARTAFSPIEIPVGAITSCIGAPFFLFLLARGGRKGGFDA